MFKISAFSVDRLKLYVTTGQCHHSPVIILSSVIILVHKRHPETVTFL